MIAFRDFVPQVLKERLLGPNDLEHLDVVVTRANEWIAAENIDVLNVGTIPHPGVWTETPSAVTHHPVVGTHFTYIRVWYRA